MSRVPRQRYSIHEGKKFGRLTVLGKTEDGRLRCLCDCGRETAVPKALAKPSGYPRQECAVCAAGVCEVCGADIPPRPGRPAKTCGDVCRKIRAAKRELDRYHSVKDTPEWQATRAKYLSKLQQSLERDPDLAQRWRQIRREAADRYEQRALRDSELRQRRLARKLELRRVAMQDPAYAERVRERQRHWYSSLSPEVKAEMISRNRGAALLRQLQAVSSELTELTQKSEDEGENN